MSWPLAMRNLTRGASRPSISSEECWDAGVQGDTITYSAATGACENGGQWEQASGLFERMLGEGVQRNPIVYSAAISACEKGMQSQQALELFEKCGLKVCACENGVQWQQALGLFERMLDADVQRSTCKEEWLYLAGYNFRVRYLALHSVCSRDHNRNHNHNVRKVIKKTKKGRNKERKRTKP